MPVRRFDLDAAIIFSDILVIPQALGVVVDMTSEGPKIAMPLKQDEALASRLNLNVNISQRLSYVYEALTMTRHALEGKCPLIGFSGAPWTLMCYMIEGGGSKTMSKAKKWLYQDPKKSFELLDVLADKVTDHLVEQARAGAQLLQLFESNAEYLTLELYREFAYPQIIKICTRVRERLKALDIGQVPLIVFAKGGHYAMDLMSKDSDKIDVLSLDWTIDPSKIRQITGGRLCLQGNLDPCALYSERKDLTARIERMMNSFGTQQYIANLGHGIYPDMDLENVKVMVDFVHKYSRELNKTSLDDHFNNDH